MRPGEAHRQARFVNDEPFYIYHTTWKEKLPEIKKHGLKAIEPGSGEGHTQIEQAIREAEAYITHATCSHGKSVFFYNDKEEAGLRGRPYVVVDVRKLMGREGDASWTEQNSWESLVAVISEGRYKEWTEEDWERMLEEFASSYCATEEEYPIGEDAIDIQESGDAMPPKDPERQIFVRGDIPPEAIVGIVEPK